VIDRINNWRMKLFLWVGLPVIAVLGLAFAGPNVAPAWQAKSGQGTVGTFTAVGEECGRRSCTWYGDFEAAEGGARRTHVILYDAPDGLAQGVTAPARDTGASKGVFSTTGGSTWLTVTGITVVGALAAVAWVVLALHTLITRRRDRAEIDRLARTPGQD
jgi:hypothetical protein